jgi:hypothetical protein
MNLTTPPTLINNNPLSIGRLLKLSDRGKINIRSMQLCPICKSKFKPGKRGLECPNKHRTIPTKYYLDWYYEGDRFFSFGLNSYTEAIERATEIKHLIKDRRFSIEDFKGSRKKVKKKYQIKHVIKEYLQERLDTVSKNGMD